MDKQTQKILLEKVKQSYEEIAGDFNETRKKYLWPELFKLTNAVKDGDRILDVGCGNGRLLQGLKGKDVSYLGLDQNEKLTEAAQKNYPAHNFILGDILELNKIPELNFDYAFCVAVLHHLPGEDLRLSVLRQLKNKIKENGRIVVTVWDLWTQPKFRRLILKFFLLKLIKKNRYDCGDILYDWKNSAGKIISQRYYHAFRKGELKKLSKKAGLKIEKIYQDKYNYYLILKK